MHGRHTATSTVENSAQVSSYQIKIDMSLGAARSSEYPVDFIVRFGNAAFGEMSL